MSDEMLEVFSSPSDEGKVEEVAETTSEAEEVEAKTEEKAETEEKSEKEAKDESKDKPEPQYTDNEKALYAKSKDEREKRQKAEQELKELREKLEKLETPEKTPSVFEDEEGFTESLRNEFKSELTRAKLDVARDMMMSFHKDYEEIESLVMEEIKSNPVLKADIQKAPNIAKAVYEQGKKIQQYREMKEFDPEKYKAQLKAEWEAELKKKQESSEAEDAKKDANLSPSLANARGSNVQDEKAVEELEDVFT